MTTTYVRTNDGTILVQRKADNEWGFELLDDEQSWPGGFGIASSWENIDPYDVDAATRARLDWLIDNAEADHDAEG